MLEPREADIPLLFLVLVVLPLVVYVWLGKWAEAAKRRERISLLAQRAVEETVRAESMAVTDAADPVTLKPSAKNIRYDSLNNRSFEEQFTPSAKNSWYDSLNNQSIEDQFIPSAKNSRFDSLNNRNFEEQFTPSAKNSRYDSLNNQSIKDQFIPSAKNSQFDSLNNRSLEDQFTPSAKNFRYDSLSNRSCEDQFKVKNSVAPVGGHVCARCFSPASTRCSRCKSVRYCSGKCQIIHWRQVHKHDCREVETTSSCSSPMYGSMEAFPGHAPVNDNLNSMHFGHVNKQDSMDNAPPGSLSHSSAGTASSNCAGADVSHDTTPRRKSIDKRSRKPNRDTMRRSDPTVLDSVGDPSKGRSKNVTPSNDATVGDAESQEITSIKPITHKHVRQQDNMFETGIIYGPSSSLHLGQNGTSSLENGGDFAPSSGNLSNMENCAIGETMDWNHSFDATVTKGSIKVKSATNHSAVKNSQSSKPVVEASGEELYSKKEEKCWVADASKVDERRDTVAASGSNGVSSLGILKMMCLRKSTKVAREDSTKQRGMHKRKQMLFPYDEFMKIFTCELATNLSPRGLINCGNSCYANAVLQCLMCTKPLIVFLLHRSHSRTCCGKDWCLMCELEQLVASLREDEGPLSPSRILHHMQNINCQIGDGSQEDAHEFLRLLVASMQLICLEGLGGENNVDPKLQETTFIQHTFGGRLRSKVKCLRCHHESERYESIMDLTLEIFGWVESLEDALTQFTTPEELNGENMYRCGRCAAYVHARKQLSIHEAPNILTIVLKRFQEGQYGKINKCISFPDMLDMVPFMTGTGDIPPLYILYAVVVHLDTLNASFSGHYVAYVKDAQGTWLRIDDSEVQPVQPSQVMSEGAYMLFYIRSFPRPEGAFCKKSMKQQARPSTTQTQKPSKQGHSRTRSHFVTAEPSSDPNADNGTDFVSHHDSFSRMTANRHIAEMTEFSDATSSDWSVFTSSDDASFTTDSTRDSFSTVDYADMCNGDTFSSIFNNLYPPSSPQNTICRTRFSSSKPQTRFISQERGCVLDSYLSNQPPYRVCKQHNHSEVTDDSPVKDGSNSYHSMSVKDGSNRKSSVDLTSSHHKL